MALMLVQAIRSFLPFPVYGSERPNIIFVFSDDHARHAISSYGSKVNQTPNIDRIASDGARFANAFVTNSICTPSRATLLTGQYSHVNGVPVFNRFDGSLDHVAKRLGAGGYHTGMIGKWHLGSDPTGFDRWVVLPGQGAYWNPEFLVPGKKLILEGHCTDVTTELGIEFMAKNEKRYIKLNWFTTIVSKLLTTTLISKLRTATSISKLWTANDNFYIWW
jgi:hypothetical protein